MAPLNPKIAPLANGDLEMTWTADPSCFGYRFYVDGQPVSKSSNPTQARTTFGNPHGARFVYGIARAKEEAAENVIWPPPVTVLGVQLEQEYPRLPRSTGATKIDVGSVAALKSAADTAPPNAIVTITSDLDGLGKELNLSRRLGVGAPPITITQKSGVKLKNFTQWYLTTQRFIYAGLDVSGFTAAGLKFTNTGAGVYADDNESVGCHIHDGPAGMGILSTPGITKLQIWDPLIHEVGAIANQNHDHGMYLSGKKVVVANPMVYNCAAYCIQLYPDFDGVVVAATCDDGYVHSWSRGGLVFGSEGGGQTKDVRIIGLIGTNAPNAGAINYWRPGMGNQGLGSLGWMNGASYDFQLGPYVTYDGCIHADPMYVNEAARDYRIRKGSPATNLAAKWAGMIPAKDRLGIDRVTADAGCYAVALA